jgi:hypothetical protein
LIATRVGSSETCDDGMVERALLIRQACRRANLLCCSILLIHEKFHELGRSAFEVRRLSKMEQRWGSGCDRLASERLDLTAAFHS